MSKPFDNSGKGALWSSKFWEQGSRAPRWTGNVVADRDIKRGEEIPLAVWAADRKHDKSPVMTLKIDRYEKGAPETPPTEDAPFDDDLGF